MTQQSHYQAYTLRKPKLKKTHASHCSLQLFTIARTWKRLRSPMTNEWIKKLWYIYTMEYSAIKRNTFDSVLMGQMNLEPIIQSEVSQKKKYHILTHIYGIQKDENDKIICRAAMETQTQRSNLWTWEEGEGKMYGESNMETSLPLGKQIANGNLLYNSGNSKRSSVQPREVGWEERWEGGSRGREHMNTYG